MSSAAKLAANTANAQHSTGPRTDEGKAASSQNATKTGLFSTADFIRPGEEAIHAELNASLHADLAPVGTLELAFVDEIRRALWRLRRCGEIEAGFVSADLASPIPDPMQNEATAQLQLSVDRARAQSHRLLQRSMNELRRLQTERHFRNEFIEGKRWPINLGLCEWRTVVQSVGDKTVTRLRQNKLAVVESELRFRPRMPEIIANSSLTGSKAAEMPGAKRTQLARNATCPCGSGEKYKRCCGEEAPPFLNAA
jgi:hypothetical protein